MNGERRDNSIIIEGEQPPGEKEGRKKNSAYCRKRKGK